MGRLVKGMLGAPIAGAAAVQSEDAEAGVVTRNGKQYIQSFHGGPAGIENFDLGFVGTGEGAQVRGWGIYSGDNIKTGEKYKKDRQADYDAGFKSHVFTDGMYAHKLYDQPVELRVGGAPQSFYIDVERYYEIVDEQVKRYGPNVDAVNRAIQRSLTKEDMLRADRMRNLSSDWDNRISGLPLHKDRFNTFNTERAEWRMMAQKTLQEFYGDSLDQLTERVFESVADQVPLEAQSFQELGDKVGYEWYDLAMARLLKAEERVARRHSLDRYDYTKERAEAYKRAQERGIKVMNPTGNPAYVQYNQPPPDPNGFDFEYVKPSSFDSDLPDQLINLDAMAEGTKKASLYEVLTDATPEELMWWDRDIRDHGPLVQNAMQKAMKNLYQATLDYPERFEGTGLYNSSGFGDSGLERVQKTIKRMAQGDFQKGINGGVIIEMLAPPGRTNRKDWGMGVIAPQELSYLLREYGIKGITFPDGWTRNKTGEKEYNYVWYFDDIHKLNELGFTLPIVPASMALGGTIAAGVPLVSKEIAERFPLPQEEQGYLDRVTDPETYKNALAPYMPALQFFGNNIAEGLQPLEYPARGLAAAGRAGLTLSQGGSVKEARDGLLDTLMKPYEETAQEAGEYVLKQTNSPALATGAYMGMILADPSNYVGP
jgi:hypothetical protein